jgi:hypothetical protein
MTLPMCAELPLMMLFSMLCTDEDGKVVDLRVDNYDAPRAPILFSSPSHSSSSSGPTTTTKSFSSITTTTDSSSNKDEKQRKPYCDEVSIEQYKSIGVCGDRKDGDDIDGYPCGNGILKADWRDCDGGLYGDNDDEIEYVEDTNTEDIGYELGNIMKDDDNDDSANNMDADELVENIGDELGDIMKTENEDDGPDLDRDVEHIGDELGDLMK